MIGYKNAAQAFLVKETMYELAAHMAREFPNIIVLEAPVRAISQTSNNVTVNSDKGVWECDYAIVAVPLPLTVRIAYEPALPLERDLLAQRTHPWGQSSSIGWRTRSLFGATVG